MSHRLISTATAILATLAAMRSPCAAQGEGPTIRGRLGESVPADAGRATVELFPLLDPHGRALVELGEVPVPAAAAREQVRPDGSFTLAAPGPGPWQLRVTVPGDVPQERSLPPDFDVVELEPVPRMPAERVSVTVLGPAGGPLAGARLEAGGVIQFGWRASAVPDEATGDDGRAVVHRPLREDLGAIVTAWAPGLAESAAIWPRDSAPVTIRVPAAEPRRLELRDASGRPLAGAVIRFEPGPGGRNPAPRPAGATDEQGRVEAALPAGAEAVRIETGRGWAVSLPLPPGCGRAETPCRLDLPAPLEVAGEVRDAVSSRVLGGALVWAVHRPDQAVTTDGRGRFVLRSAPGPRPDRVFAEAGGYAAWSGAPPEPSEPLLIALEPAMRIAGRVVDPEGVPLEGVRLRLQPADSHEGWPPEPSWQEVVTTSFADGAFRLPDVAEAAHRLRAELAGYAPVEIRPLPGSADRLEIVLTPGGAVVGRLVGLAGEPVGGGRARLLSAPSARGRSYRFTGGEVVAEAGATAGDDGRFTVGNVAAGRYELLAGHPDHATRLLPPFEVAEGETVDLGTIELAAGGGLTGRVVDPEGRPLGDVRLEAGPASSRLGGSETSLVQAHGVSDGDGRFELTGLPAGEPLQLTAHHSDYPAAREAGIVLPLEEPLLVELRKGSRVFGRVLGPRGEPIEGASVGADVRVPHPDGSGSSSGGNGWDQTDAAGGFEIEGLGAGDLHLRAHADGYPEREVEGLTIGDAGEVGPIEIRLDAGAEVSGRVLAPDGSPAAGASVSVHTGRTPAELGIRRPSVLAPPDRPVPASSASTRSDARGDFVIFGAAPGSATVTAEHDRLGDAVAELVVAPGANTIDLILDPRGRVEGRVVVAGGAPVAGAEVELAVPGGGSFGDRRRERTDGEGRFLFRWLTAGDYRVGASAPGLLLEGAPVTVTVSDALTPSVELVLTPGEEIAGRILGVPDAELLRIRVSAHETDPGGASPSAEPGPDGRYRLSGLGPGRWTVNAHGDTSRSARGEVEVVAGGGPYRLDLDLGGGLTLTGSVRLQGEPLAGASVTIAGALAGDRPLAGAYVETAFDGTFRADGLEPGDYQLMVGLGGSTLGRRDLTLTADDQIHLDLTAASLFGRVVDADGEPVAGATVLATVEGRSLLEAMSGTTDTDSAGRFAFSHLAPGRYVVHASVQGRPVSRTTVALEAGDRRELEIGLERGFELVLVPSASGGVRPHLLTVMVFQEDGVMPVYVSSTPVSADGRAVLADVPAGAGRLVVHAEGTAMVEAAAEVPGPPLAVVLPPPTVLEVEAPALAESGVVPLVVTGPDGRAPAVLSMGFGAQLVHGRTRLELLPPGTWTVHAVGPDAREYRGTATTGPEQPARLVLE